MGVYILNKQDFNFQIPQPFRFNTTKREPKFTALIFELTTTAFESQQVSRMYTWDSERFPLMIGNLERNLEMETVLQHENVWCDKYKYHDAERQYFENLSKQISNGGPSVATKPSSPPSASTKVTRSLPDPPVKSSPPPPVLTQSTLVTSSTPAQVVVDQLITQSTNNSNIKTKTIVIGPDTNEISLNNKNKEKRFRVKERHRNKKRQLEEDNEKKSGNNQVPSNNPIMKNTLADEVAKARQHIQNSLECVDGIAALTTSNKEAELLKRVQNLENKNKTLQDDVTQLKETVGKLTMLINNLEKKCAVQSQPSSAAAAVCSKPAQPAAAKKPPQSAPAKKPPQDDDDDGVDLFGSDSDDDDQEAKKIREQRLAEYASRKAKKPVLIAKSNIILDVKPWDDETNMQELEAAVRQVATDGLVWGASKLVPLAYGIHKLQISCVVEDDKVSVDWLQETIQEIENYVQSVDIAAFNKV